MLTVTTESDRYYDELQSSVITFLRLPLALLVVMIHVYGSLVYGGYSGRWSGGLYDCFHIMFSQGICRIAVPAFFFFSGYLYFSKLSSWNTKVYLEKERKRIKSLVVPYIIWNFLAVGIVVAVKYFKSIVGIEPFSIFSIWNEHGGLRLLWDSNQLSFDGPVNILGVTMKNCFPANGALWFIRDLFMVTLLSPVIHWLIRKAGRSFICITMILMIFDIWIPVTGFSSLAFAFFSIGAYLKLNGKNMVIICRSFEKVSYFLTVILLGCVLVTYHNHMVLYAIMQRTMSITGTIAVINLASRIIERKKLIPSKTLANSSFVVFAAQALYLISLSATIMNKVIPFDNDICGIIRYVLTSCLVALIGIAIYVAARKVSPKICSLITGGR